MHDRQTPAELEAHYGPDGPVQAAEAWIIAVFHQRDFRASWPLTDPVFRLVLAQDWLWVNREHPAVRGADLEDAAASLSELGDGHPLWGLFAESMLADFAGRGFDLESWKFLSGSRPVSLDYELLFFTDTGGESGWITGPTELTVDALLMHHVAGAWRFCGFSGIVPEPSWPPKPPPAWSPADY